MNTYFDNAAAARKERRRLVRVAMQSGGTVSFDLRTLIEDGHSLNTIRRVYRAPEKR